MTKEEKLAKLSKREQELCSMICSGLTLPAVARELDISTHTARNHLKHTFRKLGVHSQNELTAYMRGDVVVLQELPTADEIATKLADAPYNGGGGMRYSDALVLAPFILETWIKPAASGRHAGKSELSWPGAQRVIDKINESDEITPQQLATWVNAEF